MVYQLTEVNFESGCFVNNYVIAFYDFMHTEFVSDIL